jgi:hypothetical protein
MSTLEAKERLRREQNILDRLEGVRRLIQMETTLMTTEGAKRFRGYRLADNGSPLLNEVRYEIQVQLLSLVALCYGDNPDIGEPGAMLEWSGEVDGEHPEDYFRRTFNACLHWNA